MAGGHERTPRLALCRRAGPSGSSRPPAAWTPAWGVVFGRVARWGAGADEVLAFNPAPGHRGGWSCGASQTALARRARLPGAQAGDRVRALRGSRMARVPSPRHLVHRGLWLPGLWEKPDSPLKPTSRNRPNTSPTRRLPPSRRFPPGRSATCRTPSRPCASTWPALLLRSSHDVPAAIENSW